MFLLRARNQLNEKKHRVLKYTCLYIASVELFMDIGPDQSAMKKTIERTVGNLDLKTVSGDSVNLLINNNGIVIQDSRTETLIMAHALKRICFTTSFPKKKIYVFVSRLPQEERIFAHFFLMHDKSSGQKITQELAKAFTHAYKEKKTRSIQRDHRRSMRAQPQPLNSGAQRPMPPVPPVASAPPKKNKAKSPPFTGFDPPPPAYADQIVQNEQFLEAFDVESPVHLPSAPPLSAGVPPYNPPLPTLYPFSQQPALNNGHYPPVANQQLLQPEPQSINSVPAQWAQDPFSPFHASAQPPNSVLGDGLPSYNSATVELQEGRRTNDGLLINLDSPEHIQKPATNLYRSLSTSNMLDDTRSFTPPPPPFQELDMIPQLPFNQPQPPLLEPNRVRVAERDVPARPMSGLYPALSYGMEERTHQEPIFERNANNIEEDYQLEKYELANEHWFQPGLPRDIIIEILLSQKEGNFFIRESASQTGKLVLSVRSSTDVSHYLIVKTKKGYHLENDKLFFPSLSFLVMHHSINKGLLPCTLSLSDTNPSYLRADHLESSDSEAEGEDPIYTQYAVTNSMKIHQ